MDEHGLTRLASVTKIKLLSDKHKRRPFPLSWDEQERSFRALPIYLAQVSLFAVNVVAEQGKFVNSDGIWRYKFHTLKRLCSSFQAKMLKMETSD